jgi:hypothetical protein
MGWHTYQPPGWYEYEREDADDWKGQRMSLLVIHGRKGMLNAANYGLHPACVRSQPTQTSIKA